MLLWTVQTAMTQGRLLQEEQVASRYLGTNRTIRVYLPPSYERKPARRFAVLYLHDGQNVFSSAGPYACFGWGNWRLDQTVDELVAAGKMQEIIMVAIDNSQRRYEEYRGPAYPYTASELKELKRKPPGAGDDRGFQNYAAFLIEELKPKIDREYRTLDDPAHTGLLGSSLGGLCSLALAWENAEVFGLAASLSGSFQLERTNFLKNILGRYKGKPKPVRVYLDSGTMDFTGDDDGCKQTTAVAEQLRRLGWKDKRTLQHFVDEKPLAEAELAKAGLRHDKWEEARTSQHNELYWRLRVWRALTFLFPPEE
jgi:predicted alpha/beta superfamily hydrolase